MMSNLKKLVIILVSFGVVLFVSAHSLQAKNNPPSWSYGGNSNPTLWGTLNKDFATCGTGHAQSPINIKSVQKSQESHLEFSYEPTPLEIVNNGHTVQVNYQEGSSVNIEGNQYQLLQFHFHTPSEHTRAGRASAMEIHLVHRNDQGELAVVGILVEEGKANSAIAEIWQNTPSEPGKSFVSKATINAADLLPKNSAYFSYSGSLTTPPCSENVSWNILKEPVTLSPDQISTFADLYQVNARPVQSISDRKIELHQ